MIHEKMNVRLFYCELANKFSNENAGIFMKAIFDYGFYEKEPDFSEFDDEMIRAFEQARPYLDEDHRTEGEW